MGQDGNTDRKAKCDLDHAPSRLALVRDVVGLANSGGGRLEIGVDPAGHEVGIPAEHAARLDADPLGDLVAGFVRPDRIELTVSERSLGDGRSVVVIDVPGAAEPPLVLDRPGTYTNSSGNEVTVFAARSVHVRRNGRTELARRDTYRQWRDDAVERAREEIVERLAMVVEAPAGSRVRIITEGEVLDEPRFLLSRSADVFRQRPEHLLSGDALAYLWLHRSVLDIDPTARELLVQSAMRKRATLYLWVAELELRSDEARDYLQRALGMRDRDKSDAARSILLLAVVFLDDDHYESLRQGLASSSYTHMREAAEALPDPAAARAQLAVERLASVDGRPVAEVPTARLEAVADELLEGSLIKAARRLPPIGLELLRRRSPYPGGPTEQW